MIKSCCTNSRGEYNKYAAYPGNRLIATRRGMINHRVHREHGEILWSLFFKYDEGIGITRFHVHSNFRKFVFVVSVIRFFSYSIEAGNR